MIRKCWHCDSPVIRSGKGWEHITPDAHQPIRSHKVTKTYRDNSGE